MLRSDSSRFLRLSLLADAAISGAVGVLMLAGAGLLDGLLGLPVPLLRGAGLVLVPYVAALVWLARREDVPRQAVWMVILANAVWAAGCVLLLLSGWIAPTWLGVAFVLVQAVTVLVFAELQYMALRRPLAMA